MRRKNLVARKAKNKNLLIKNQEIKKIYKKFKSIIFEKVGKNNFALGVSGGADSLCLAYFSKIYTSEFNNKIYTLIVNHNLRRESKKEALNVKNILKKNNINSNILHWKGKIPKKNIQSNARNIRYSLISNFCKKKKVKFLLTAHHADDQIENFFIRLFRGSGLTGLSSMHDSVNYNDRLKIIRPFLNIKKDSLKFTTLNFFKNFIEDPSNDNDKFLRVRIRKYRKKMETEGLNTSNIIKTINNLLLANKALNYYKNKALYKHVSFVKKNKCLINKAMFIEEAEEIVFKSFSDILSLVSGNYYPPRSRKIINLINRIKRTQYLKSTLGGCVIEKKDNFLTITKEERALKTSQYLNK